MTTLKARKPVGELSPDDFKVFPIWEFAIDEEGVRGRDETWVRPVDNQQVPANAYSQLVAAIFTTAKGRKLDGFMTVTTAENQVEITPGSIVRRGVYQCLPSMPKAQAVAENCRQALTDRTDLAKMLERAETDVFPLHYELRVKVRGENQLRTGVLD